MTPSYPGAVAPERSRLVESLGIRLRVHEWGDAALPPPAAQFAGYASLVLWSGVIISGRLVAYNWFDCDIQPQPDFINWAAGCVVP